MSKISLELQKKCESIKKEIKQMKENQKKFPVYLQTDDSKFSQIVADGMLFSTESVVSVFVQQIMLFCFLCRDQEISKNDFQQICGSV